MLAMAGGAALSDTFVPGPGDVVGAGIAVGAAITATVYYGKKLLDAVSEFRGKPENKLPRVNGPPDGTIKKPGVVGRYGSDGDMTSRTCAKAGHGCDGAHTHVYKPTKPGHAPVQVETRPATEKEKKEVEEP